MEEDTADGAGIREYISCSPDDFCARLGTDLEGLSSAEATARVQEYGRNVLPERKRRFSQNVIVQFRNLFNVLLIVAAILSFVSGFSTNDSSSINMGIVILAVVIVSVVFSLFQEYRAERAVKAIKELIPSMTRVRRDGIVVQIQVADVVPGDLIMLEAGDRVPADARVTECYEFAVDNSALTGESEPVPRSSDSKASPGKGLAECENVVFAGTIVASGSGKAIVFATGERTEFGRIVKLAQTVVEPPSPLQREIDRTARVNFVLAIAVGFLFLLIAFFGLGLELAHSLLFMIGVMISLVPEGFQVTMTLALALSALKMAKRNVVVKRLSSVETLGGATTICVDKTGTITEGQMTVRKAWVGGKVLEVTGEGYEPEGEVTLDGKRVTAADGDDLLQLFRVACLNNTATVVPPLDRRKSRWTAVGDSTEAALLVLAAKAGLQSKDQMASNPRIGLIPFESRRKMMTSVHRGQDGKVTAYVKGAGTEVLKRCTRAFWNGAVVDLTPSIGKELADLMDGYAREAYRVLALAVRPLDSEPARYDAEVIEKDLVFVGLVAILDPPRVESRDAVRQSREAGIKVIMLTGDHELTAEAIARSVGIITKKGTVVTGTALAAMSDDDLGHLLDKPELVFARIAPDQKLRVVRILRKKGEIVAVTGDGVNDAPALLEANIGIAMGISGTDVARESANMVLLDDNFASIVHGVELGRAVFDNLKKFTAYVFTHNWAQLVSFIAFVLLGVPLPLAVVQILAIDLMMEIPPSLALTLEPPERGIMERPPRSKKTRLFSPFAIARSMYIGAIIGLAALYWCLHIWETAGWTLGMSAVSSATAYAQGTTITMAAIMAGQLGTVFAMRTNIQSSLSVSLRRNPLLPVGVVTSFLILLVLVYVPVIGTAFNAAPVPLFDILVLYAIAPLVLGMEEVRKLLLRRYVLPPRPVPAVSVGGWPSTGPLRPRAARTLPPFEEKAFPVAAVLRGQKFEENLVRVAADVARAQGSKLVFIRAIDGRSDEKRLSDTARLAEQLAEHLGVPYEMQDIQLAGRERSSRTMSVSLRNAVKDLAPSWILVPVTRDAIRGRRRALTSMKWIEEFNHGRVSLVSNWEARPIPSDRAPRLLIPALTRLKGEPLELVDELTKGADFPEVDIVAAKIIEMPSIVPLYSVYRPESLVDMERELSVFRSIPSWGRIRRIQPMVLLVRESGRDLAQFASDRNVDLIVMEGDWKREERGFLLKKERKVALNAECTVIVAMPPVGGN